MNKLPWLGAFAGSFVVILAIVSFFGAGIFAHRGWDSPKPAKEESLWLEKLTKKDLGNLVKHLDLNLPPATGNYALAKEGVKYVVETSFDNHLQQYITNFLRRTKTDRAAVVVLKPDTGQVLAMANYKRDEAAKPENLCLKADFPAASLFKIVAAAAAIEARGFTPNKTLVFRGRKHTLYKSQLKQKKGRYTVETNLKKAFSGSINPVFGKMGIYDLGKELMAEYAEKFLFNQPIPFEFPLQESTIYVPEDDFGLAEIASGFNKRTRISPLHAALITAAIANKGTMMEPWVVERVKDHTGKILYSVIPSKLASPLEEKTAGSLKILMDDTVIYGTGRKAFRPLRRKKKFRNIELGAKSGTINDESDRYKYDWFTAYALPDNGDGGICTAILAIHGKKIGIRAAEIARYIINQYFKS
ncbi:penicillin-binding transpeptidase domain-containing protein [bacterium]|nr:penicillin-binding transpeptidase domain-containing protein [bacterium]